MNKEQHVDATVNPVKSVSSIWFIPFIAVLIGCWMLYYQWANQGPLITLHFESAEGLEEGKTKIKFRNVNIGNVETISINEAADGVIITARMSKSAENILVEDSSFWVVTPKISLAGVSGLSTLISGVYIEISPGLSKQARLEFEALDSPPVTPLGTPGLHITLNSDDQFAYSKGDPIIYKGLTVGQFEDIYFNFEERIVYYNVFIKAPYHKLITTNTKFWDVSGLNVDLNADGLSIKTGNLETLLTNGVTFDVPTGMEVGQQITERDYFDIYANYELASDQRFKQSVNYVVLVSNTIRGLKVGAPVEYRGVLIGHVKSTNISETNQNGLFSDDLKIPVLISLQPGRVGLPDNEDGKQLMDQQNTLWIHKGLKATLKTGNLLTGSLFVELQHFEKQTLDNIQTYAGYTVIPTVTDQFTQITEKLGVFIDKLNQLPLETTAENANKTLNEITNMTKDFQHTSQSLNSILQSAHQQELIKELNTTLQSLSTLSHSYSADSDAYEQLEATLKTLSDTLYELKPLLNQLKHQPNGLIFNSGNNNKLVPKKHKGDK
ncbi:MAG: intermembrane transport protein PqiB [Colwellia sp.]|nr:intermembrane transport protein PqiB [Colwellia sp.]MCW9081280.1 intermembrane transport protein PqiB [Colwellia sp.]